MGNLIGNVQDKIKMSSSNFAMLVLRILSGAFVGLTLALIGQEVIGYGTFSFCLVIAVVLGSLLRISKNWSWLTLLIFNVICVLIGLILRMYILIAPGAQSKGLK